MFIAQLCTGTFQFQVLELDVPWPNNWLEKINDLTNFKPAFHLLSSLPSFIMEDYIPMAKRQKTLLNVYIHLNS